MNNGRENVRIAALLALAALVLSTACLWTGMAGEVTIFLPADVGVRATVKGGLGEVDAMGLRRDGEGYMNDAYGRSPTTIRLSVEGGVGGVTLEVVG